jgi:putative oxidoreductase
MFMKLVLLLGRLLFAFMFIQSSIGHFSHQTVKYAMSKGVPFAEVLVPISGVMALLGGVSILLGFKARLGAWLIVLFLIPVTIMMHDFWTIDDIGTRQIQQGMFMKNLSMLGGALIIAYFGSGPLSVDNIKAHEIKSQT